MSCVHDESANFEIEVKRLDTIYVTDPFNTSYNDYADEYGYFWDVYSQNVIFLPAESFADSLNAFQQEQDFAKPYQDVINQYQDFSPQHKKLSRAFYHYHVAFPNKAIPIIVTFFGGFNYIAIATDSTLGIGLEMFLGNDNYYSNLIHKFPKYMHHQFQSEYLTSVAVNGWLEAEFPAPFDSFLAQMIHYGNKQIAVIHHMHYVIINLMNHNLKPVSWVTFICYKINYMIIMMVKTYAKITLDQDHLVL